MSGPLSEGEGRNLGKKSRLGAHTHTAHAEMILKATGLGPSWEVHSNMTQDTEINMEKHIDTHMYTYKKTMEDKQPGPNTPGMQVLF